MKTAWILPASVGLFAVLSGCSKPDQGPAAGAPPSAPAPQSGGQSAPEGPTVQTPGGMGGSPMGRGMAAPPKPAPDAPLAPTPNEDAAVEAAEKSGDKAAISKAYLDRAVRHRIDDKAGDKVKYPAVLADLKKSLEADPNNERAKKVLDFVEAMAKTAASDKPAAK